jgi:GTP-binding protein
LVTIFISNNSPNRRLRQQHRFRQEHRQYRSWRRESPRIICLEIGGVSGPYLVQQWQPVFIVQISSAIFDRSAPDLAACPDESLPEFAFIGRSNAGKSSLLNLLAGKDGLARVSTTPGFTKLINFFTINQSWRLVDLPGYGFAEGAKKDSARFNQAVLRYLQHRTNLCLVFALIDSGLAPQEMDLALVEWLARNTVPFVLVFTKTDKETPATVRANIAAFRAGISAWFEQPPAFFTCSATQEQGRPELLGVIEEALSAIQAEAKQTGAFPLRLPRNARAIRKSRPDLSRPW